MKQICYQCGCHFPQDFKETLKPPCNYWGDHKVGNMSEESKKELWDWIFSMPTDKIAVKENISLQFGWQGTPVIASTKFEKLVPNWEDLSEEERQAYQKEFFKKQFLEQAEDLKLDPAKRIN